MFYEALSTFKLLVQLSSRVLADNPKLDIILQHSAMLLTARIQVKVPAYNDRQGPPFMLGTGLPGPLASGMLCNDAERP